MQRVDFRFLSLIALLLTCAAAVVFTSSPGPAIDAAEAPALPASLADGLVDRTESDDEKTEFLRFIDEGDERGRLETATVTYRNADGVEVELIGVVHIADGAYYRQFRDEFRKYDALLYEMIKDKGVTPGERSGGGSSFLSILQRGMKDVLKLEFQLDGIDYTRPNFVHADMDPATFFRMQRQKGESLIGMMLKSMQHEWKLQAEGRSRQPGLLDLIRIFTSPDASRSMKYLFAKQLEGMEELLAGIEGDEGSVIVAERNKVALGVLDTEIERGHKKLGIFYGAAHMPDFEKRLIERGFEKTGQRWYLAWNVGSREVKSKPKRLRI